MNEEWRRLMLTLPDSLFFDVVRTYTGKFNTPFNKHDLIARLESFFLRKETKERVIAFISRLDAEVLEAIRFLDEPPVETLFSFFKSDEEGREGIKRDLHHELLNLEYRLLVIPDTAEEVRRLRLNPLLRRELEERVLGPEVLFPSSPAAESLERLPWMQETTVLGFLAFFDQNRKVLKADGSLKKRPADQLNRSFPGIFSQTPAGRRRDMVIRSLRSLGLLEKEGENLKPRWERLRMFGRLHRKERLCYCWSHSEQGYIRLKPGRAELMKAVVEGMDPGRIYPRRSLRRLITGVCLKDRSPLQDPGPFIDLLPSLGIAFEHAEGLQRTSRLYIEESEDPETVLFQPNMQVTVKPEAPLAYSIPACRSADLERADVYLQFEIHKGSFNRILRAGWRAEEYLQLFENNGSDIPANLRALFGEWEQEYLRVQLFDGIVLTVAEEVRHLVEHNRDVRRWIRRTVAPGVYLLAREEYREWSRALERAGIEQLPAVTEAAPSGAEGAEPEEFTPPGLRTLLFHRESRVRGGTDPAAYEEELFRALSGLATDKETEEELQARIKRRVILFPEQLDTGLITEYGKSEAKGLDFMGKVRLIEQTMQTGREILEVIERTSFGEPHRYFISPVRLDKSGKELVLLGKTLPEKQELRLEVRKLSLVRRLKSALFYPPS